jgi:hypothetical protein
LNDPDVGGQRIRLAQEPGKGGHLLGAHFTPRLDDDPTSQGIQSAS